MKKILSLLVGLCIFTTCTIMASAETNTTPQIIENYMTWNIEGNTLYIDGNGRMDDYSIEESFGQINYAPWYSSRQNITKIVFEGNITSIGDYAFAYFENLTEVSIPASVRKIGEGAFGTCSSLENIIIPKTVKEIETNVFAACGSLDAIYYTGNETEWYDMDTDKIDYTVYCNSTTTPQLIENYMTWDIEGDTLHIDGNGRMDDYSIEEYFGEINYAPWYSSGQNVTKIVFEGNITSIGDYAFAYFENLTDVNIPTSVRKIGEGAFGACSSLETIVIPKNVKTIEASAFAACSSLDAIYYTGDETEWYDMDIEEINHTVYCNSNTTPQVIEHYMTWNIEGNTLYIDGNGRMNDYSIEESFGQINYAPWYSSRLDITKIVFDGNITSIGDYAFAYFENLTDVSIPASVRKIGEGAFGACSSLESIIIPKTVKVIESSAFAACSNLDAIYYTGSETEWYDMDIDKIDYTVYGNCIPATVTFVSTDGKSFIIKPSFVGKDNMVMLALYKDNRFVRLYHTTYQGNDITFTVTEDYDSAKVLVWKDFKTIIPITEAEQVK